LSVKHPIANLTQDELDQRARDIVPQIVQLLLEWHGLRVPSSGEDNVVNGVYFL